MSAIASTLGQAYTELGIDRKPQHRIVTMFKSCRQLIALLTLALTASQLISAAGFYPNLTGTSPGSCCDEANSALGMTGGEDSGAVVADGDVQQHEDCCKSLKCGPACVKCCRTIACDIAPLANAMGDLDQLYVIRGLDLPIQSFSSLKRLDRPPKLS